MQKLITNKTPPKFSITRQLWTDLGRSVGVTMYSHQTGVVKRLKGPTFPLTATALQSKGHTFRNF